eukprot:tig00000459_g1084.t1
MADLESRAAGPPEKAKLKGARGCSDWLSSKAREFREQASTLKSAPRELWLTYFLKFLESYAYFAVSYIFVIYLSDEFGFSDAEASWIYGLFGTIYALASMLMGSVVDNLGVRRSLIVGGIVLTLSRLALALTASRTVVYVIAFGTLPLGRPAVPSPPPVGPVSTRYLRSALGIPVMATGIRRYTNDANRAFGYSLFYIAMNVSAFIAGLLVDAFRYAFGVPDPHARLGRGLAYPGADLAAGATSYRPGQLFVSFAPFSSSSPEGEDGPGMTGYRWLVLSAAASTALFLVLAALFVREIEVDPGGGGGVTAFAPRRSNPLRLAREIFATRRFWRFILLIVLLIGVRSVLQHLNTTFPKYVTREIGAGFPYGTVISLNPLLIVALVPLITAFYYTRCSPFECISGGVVVTAAAPLFLVIGPYYATAIAFILTLSVGEAIWSPRLYEYTCTIAPVGREGTYQSLAVVPLFAAKLLVGAVSGPLLDAFCPLEGPRNSRVIWALVGALAAASPLLLFLLRGVIERKDPEDHFDELPEGAEGEAEAEGKGKAEPPGGAGVRAAAAADPESGAGGAEARRWSGAAVELRAPALDLPHAEAELEGDEAPLAAADGRWR